MVLAIPYPSHSAADGPAKHRKHVRPLPAAAPPLLHQGPDVAVASEPFLITAVLALALVELDARRTPCFLFWCRRNRANQPGVVWPSFRIAFLTWWVTNEGEKIPFEPPGRVSVSRSVRITDAMRRDGRDLQWQRQPGTTASRRSKLSKPWNGKYSFLGRATLIFPPKPKKSFAEFFPTYLSKAMMTQS